MEIELERLLTPRQVGDLEGCSLTTVYGRLADGTYTAIKDGRKTLIHASSVSRRRVGLPQAKYGLRAGIKGVPSKSDAAEGKRPRKPLPQAEAQQAETRA
jgi:hypothetical protein